MRVGAERPLDPTWRAATPPISFMSEGLSFMREMIPTFHILYADAVKSYNDMKWHPALQQLLQHESADKSLVHTKSDDTPGIGAVFNTATCASHQPIVTSSSLESLLIRVYEMQTCAYDWKKYLQLLWPRSRPHAQGVYHMRGRGPIIRKGGGLSYAREEV